MYQGTVTSRTEKQRISLSSERTVLDIHSNGISCLILECEIDVVLHTIFSLISLLYFSISLLEKMLVLRRNSNHKVS